MDVRHDLLAIDSLSAADTVPPFDAVRPTTTQLKPDVSTSTVMLTAAVEPVARDLTRSAEFFTPHTSRHGVMRDSVSADGVVSSSAVMPVTSTLANTSTVAAAGLSRSSRVSLATQQHPKSLEQEFTLLNLDIPNVTIHSVCISVLLLADVDMIQILALYLPQSRVTW